MRKKFILLLSLICAIAGVASAAEFKMPKSVYKMDKLEEAKAKAKEKKKPLAFLYFAKESN